MVNNSLLKRDKQTISNNNIRIPKECLTGYFNDEEIVKLYGLY